MWNRALDRLGLAALILTTPAAAQTATRSAEPVSNGRTLSEWIADLRAAAPLTRHHAAYEMAGMGPAAAPAVPNLIEALQDQSAAVRYAATIALREIGPAARPAVPALKAVLEDDLNDEVAAGARRALRAIAGNAGATAVPDSGGG